jgi:hypothetical protein
MKSRRHFGMLRLRGWSGRRAPNFVGREKSMISFALGQELKKAGFAQRTGGNAVYFVNEHHKVRRENALRFWYADKAREEWEFDPSKELVYSPTLTELIEACGLPFFLSCNAAGHWYASNSVNKDEGETGATPAEAVARLWLRLHAEI